MNAAPVEEYGRMQTAWERMSHWWHKQSHFRQNCVIGVLIEATILTLELTVHPASLAWLENYALDSMMRGAASQYTVEQGDTANARRLVFIDIDERTWRSERWGGGEPLKSPRLELFQLVTFAAEARADHIVLDMLLEGSRRNAQDLEFSRKMESLLGNPAIDTNFVLVRSVRLPLDPGQVAAGSWAALPEQRTSAIDDLLARFPGRITIAAPYFVESTDGRIRDWELWKIVCRESSGSANQDVAVMPSVQLVIAADHLKQREFQAAAPWLHPTTETCPVEETSSRSVVDRLNTQMAAWLNQAFGFSVPEHQLVTQGSGGLANRIVYQTADATRQGGALGESALRRLVRVSALDVLEKSDDTRRRINDYIEGAIVVIGVSRADSPDLRRTPIGEMPGSLVVLNSIDSMLRFGLLQPPSKFVTIPLACVLIVVVAFVFARWDSVRGTLISTLGVLIALWFASYWLFKFGIWLDFALPLIGIQIHRIVKSIEERSALRH